MFPSFFFQGGFFYLEVFSHFVEHPRKLAKFVLGFYADADLHIAGTDSAGPFLEEFQGLDKEVGGD